MSFVKRNVGRAVVFEVQGQLIVGNRQEFKREVLLALQVGPPRIVIDFSRTTFIDSSGLGALITISKEIHAAGSDLRLAALSEELHGLLALTRLDTFFRIAHDLEEALED